MAYTVEKRHGTFYVRQHGKLPVANVDDPNVAHLFAAAPELLETLKAMRDRWDQYDDQDSPELGRRMRAAIFAAERTLPDATIVQAAACADLDDAARVIQDAAGIEDGGVAAIFFSDRLQRDWAAMAPSDRAPVLRQYVAFERLYIS